jgi:hypothetical protein
MKTYKEWYWGLYRWFKWKFPHFHKTLYQGIKNLIKWAPVIYHDRDWDYSFTFKILKFKLENTKEHFEKHRYFESWSNNIKWINICIKLIDRIEGDFYNDEYFSYYKAELLKEYNDDNGSYSINFKTTEDRTNEYINMYPHAKRILFSNPKWESFRHNQTGKCLAIGQIRHEKAKKLLFKILEEKIEHWWT